MHRTPASWPWEQSSAVMFLWGHFQREDSCPEHRTSLKWMAPMPKVRGQRSGDCSWAFTFCPGVSFPRTVSRRSVYLLPCPSHHNPSHPAPCGHHSEPLEHSRSPAPDTPRWLPVGPICGHRQCPTCQPSGLPPGPLQGGPHPLDVLGPIEKRDESNGSEWECQC